MNEATDDEKILQLLKTDDPKNIELAFQLCVGLEEEYGEAVAKALRKQVLYCIRNGLETEYFENLQSLSLNSKGLKVFPTKLLQLRKLRGLQMWRNQLKEIPSEISQLTQLEALSLQYNQLTTLPEEISQLTKLRDVYLYGNKFSQEEKHRIIRLLPENCDIRFKRMYNDT
ncbi:MAG TPA: hypothetical protein DCS93_31155 [Microscillaceae bacterium]|nr:hypothetical protein [Microscillaceae bacterium]